MTQAYPLTTDEIARFRSKTRVEGECIVWGSGCFDSGYGAFCARGKTLRAHRIAWEIANNRPLKEGEIVMHSCDNPKCVTPDHLSVGSVAKNNADRNTKGRQARGTRVNTNKLSEADVRNILADQRGQRVIAEHYGVARSLIQRIKQGRVWAHVR